MRDRILFSAPMVSAILAGKKTQTRRVVKLKRSDDCGPSMWPQATQDIIEWREQEGRWFGLCGYLTLAYADCPYGQPGARLYVCETFYAYGRWETRFSAKKGRDEWHFIDMTEESGRVYLYADSIPEVKTVNGRGALPGWHRRPAIFMPRKAVGIMLEVVTVRVERLQDISEADAMAEGIYWYPVHQGNGFCDGFSHLPNDVGCVFHKTAADAYRALWESINGAGSWDANPWVWVYEFKKIEEQKHEN